MLSVTRRRWLASVPLAVAARRLSAAPLGEIKLGVTTDEIDDDVAAAVRFLKEFGLSWAEVRNIWGQYNTAQPLEKIREAQALFRENGIRVSIEGTALFKTALPDGTPEGALDRQWKLLDDAMERARIFGTRQLRVFGFTYRAGAQPDRRRMPRIYELLGEAARRARQRGFRLALENVSSSYVATGADAAELLKAVKDDALGLTWDPNNAGMSGERAFPDGYRRLDPARIFHVHLRDYRRREDGKVEWCAVGDGEFDNLGQIRALRRDGFQGTFTLETHWRSPRGREYSSRTSLAGLLQVIGKV